MSNYLKKFGILCEEIINQSTITVDTFDFNFEQEDNGNITCKFDVSDNNDNLYNVIAKIDLDKTITFTINNEKEKDKELDEKSFMLKFYKDYTKFKKSYKQYQEEQNAKTEINHKTNKKYIMVDDKKIPVIELFNDKLHGELSNSTNIKVNNTTFIFRKIEDETKNLIQINFDLLNDQVKNTDIYKYNVICIVKLLNENSVPLKFILKNSKDNESVEELTRSDFSSKYKATYTNLLEAINQYEKTI